MRLNFHHKIKFVTQGSKPDSYGGVVPVNKTELVTFASIEQLKQSRSLDKVQQSLPTAWRVTIYFRDSFYPTVDNLIKWRGKIYKIITTPTVDDTSVVKFLTFDIAEN